MNPVKIAVRYSGCQLNTELDCFLSLLTEGITNKLLKQVNDFAGHKVNINRPATKRLRYTNWKDVSHAELLRFIAVTTQMGMDKRGNVRDYRATDYGPENTG